MNPSTNPPNSHASGTIFDIQRFAIHDGPGIRTSVFFKGCPLHCWWCHNPESQSSQPQKLLRASRCIRCGACVEACPQLGITLTDEGIQTDQQHCTRCGACVTVCYAGASELVGYQADVATLMQTIQSDRVFYEQSGGGVTFSGGEPLAQAGFLKTMLQACRAAGIHTAVDTSGYTPWHNLEAILADTDLFLYDLKVMDEKRHREVSGVSNHLILENLTHLSQSGAAIWIRIPLVPGINDDPHNLQAMLDFISPLAGVQQINLLPYHNAAGQKYRGLGQQFLLDDLTAHTPAQLEAIQDQLKTSGVPVMMGG
jgi:pyruvate formate lyase activating enzyme